MSTSMWAWRVILPGLGLIACSVVLRESSRPEAPASRTIKVPDRAGSSPGRVVAEGRIVARPGAEVTVGSESGGLVQALRTAEKSKVRKGDVLVEFRADELQFALSEAEARLSEADADLAYNQVVYGRKVRAMTEAAQFVADLFASRRDLDVALARRRMAGVAVARARSALDRAKVTSPIDGVVVWTFVQPGEVAMPGSRLATICDLSRLWIEAEVDEMDVARVREGDEVLVKAEGFGDASWGGKLEEIPDRVASRALRADDPGRPTDTRVLLVKIGLPSTVNLKLGQQVEVEIRPRR